MSGKKSKTKGKSYESEIAKFLTTLYGESFIRVPHSGAMLGGTNKFRSATMSAHQNQIFKGDISPPMEWKHFNCEAKSYAEFPFHQLFKGEIKYFEDWIGQTLDVADPDDFNIICMKFNRKGTYILVEGTNKVKLTNHFEYNSIKYGKWYMMDFNTFWTDNKNIIQKLATF